MSVLIQLCFTGVLPSIMAIGGMAIIVAAGVWSAVSRFGRWEVYADCEAR